MKKIAIITFDYKKSSYHETPFSISSLIASVKHFDKNGDIEIVHKGIDLNILHKEYHNDRNRIESEVLKHTKSLILKDFQNYDFIALGVTAWSEIYVKKLMTFLKLNYFGKIILGGYEVTALDKKTLLSEFPEAHFMVKGYAESSIVKILNDEYLFQGEPVIIEDRLDENYLVSPYLNNVIPVGNKIYWETKRGCPFTCGFCEWGNAAQKKVIFLPMERLLKEIELFRLKKVEAINILDGTFNFGNEQNDYTSILEAVLNQTSARVNLQTRFEKIGNDEKSLKFIQLCELNKDRVVLELGLQTIHQNEMDVIGRQNDLLHIQKIMRILNGKKINYELSLIYGIPGQTVESFLGTIEFILKNNCEKIAAYPLRIPRNSKMEKDKEKLGVKEELNIYNIFSTSESYSFTKKDHDDMTEFSNALSNMSFVKNLANMQSDLTFIVFEYGNEGSYKLTDISRKNRLKFNAPNEKIEKAISGYEELVIKILASKEVREILSNLLNVLSAKEHWFPKALSKFLELTMRNLIWHYSDDQGNRYLCSVKISDAGNVFVFKDRRNIDTRVRQLSELKDLFASL